MAVTMTLPGAPRRMAMLTVFGLGLLRPAPGTWGSLPPAVLAAVLILAGAGPLQSPAVYHLALAAILVVFCLACVAFGDEGEAVFGRKDASEIVADETAGMSLALLLPPAAGVASPGLAMFTVLLTFLAFRGFDIVKPWPAGSLQRLPGGWGVLVDDLAAAVYAWLLVQAVAWLVF